ncbi:hydroxymethylglutaryl-CoA lyase [Streptomyces sp. NPDC046805]|uniref:hydroxymethylglutaryl-CoA lyase n=1 Tax=Streptomyces sp. NPDC046805 TaxID=3155134 RepID=UPI003405A7AE
MTDFPDRVTITEVVLRDGLQLEPVIVPTAEKIRLAHRLIDAGLTSLEVGAFVNPTRVPQMADTEEVLTALLPGSAAMLHTLVFNRTGAERAVAAGARDVRFVVSASEGHSKANAGAGVEQALDRIDEAAEILAGAGVRTQATIATAFVCPFDGPTAPQQVARVATRLKAAGAAVIHLADTIGNANPSQVRETVASVRERHPDLELGLHLHDTYGMGLANAWAALSMGVAHFDASLGGIGGCPFAPGAAGNIGTDDLVHLLHREGISTGLDPETLAAVRDELAIAVGHPLSSSLSQVPAAPAPPAR